MSYILWMCPFCQYIRGSNREIHHKMDCCRCGRSKVDAEKEYVRIIGEAEVIFNEV